MTETIKWLTNLYNPALPEARESIAAKPNQAQEEAWQMQVRWLRGKLIGKPKATKMFTVEELEAQNLIGIYKIPPDTDKLNEFSKS